MALKYKLDSLDGLEESQKSLYRQEGNVFILDVDGVDDGDAIGLKRKVEELLSKNREADEKTKQAEKDAADAAEAKRLAEEEKARKNEDYKALSTSYEETIAKLEKQIADGKEQAKQEKIEKAALELSADLAEGSNQKILSRFVADRLTVNDDGDLVVTDSKGNLTISTLDQLKEEFKGEADYASLITGSKGSGSGAGGTKSGGEAAKKLSDMGDVERKELLDRNPEEFNRLVEESKNAA